MATARRVFWESVIFLSFLAALAGLYFWSGWRVDSRTKALQGQHLTELASLDERHETEIQRLVEAGDERLRSQAEKQAYSVFRAFEAGARTAIAARWSNYLASASDELAGEPGVLFVHILTPQGQTITSTGEQEMAEARLAERGEWATGREALDSRPVAGEQQIEIAAPVTESGRTVAYLWLGYDLASITDSR